MSDLLQIDTVDATPHCNTLTESGEAHFSEMSHAVAELVDNSVEALVDESQARRVDVMVYLDRRDVQSSGSESDGSGSFLVVFDNGCGMDEATTEDFSRYAYNKRDRGFTVPATSSVASSSGVNISRYGVGATDAGLYLGNRMRLLTKTKNTDVVIELVMDSMSMHTAAKAKDWSQQYHFPRYKRGLNPAIAAEKYGPELDCPFVRNIIAAETFEKSYTAVIMRLKRKHVARLLDDEGAGLVRDLAHIHHLFLRPEHRAAFELGARRHKSAGEQAAAVTIQYHYLEPPSAVPRSLSLASVNDHFEAQCFLKSKDIFKFSISMRNPHYLQDEAEAKRKRLAETLTIRGIIHYFPFDGIEETVPQGHAQTKLDGVELVTSEAGTQASEGAGAADVVDLSLDDDMPDGPGSGTLSYKDALHAIEVFWQGRLLPKAHLAGMPFYPDDSTKTREVLGLNWRSRLRGALMLGYGFDPHNNKLDVNMHGMRGGLATYIEPQAVANANVQYEPRGIKSEFFKWVRSCHEKYDKEAFFSGRLEYSDPEASQEAQRQGKCFFSTVAFGLAQDARRWAVEDKICLKFGHKTFCAVIKHFEVHQSLPRRTDHWSGSGMVVVQLRPKALFGAKNTYSVSVTRLQERRKRDGGLIAEVSGEEWEALVKNAGRILPAGIHVQRINQKKEKITLSSANVYRIAAGDKGFMKYLSVMVKDRDDNHITNINPKIKDGSRPLLIFAEVSSSQEGGGDEAAETFSIGPAQKFSDDLFYFSDLQMNSTGRHSIRFIIGSGDKKGQCKAIEDVTDRHFESEYFHFDVEGAPPSEVAASWVDEMEATLGGALPPFLLEFEDPMGNNVGAQNLRLEVSCERQRRGKNAKVDEAASQQLQSLLIETRDDTARYTMQVNNDNGHRYFTIDNFKLTYGGGAPTNDAIDEMIRIRIYAHIDGVEAPIECSLNLNVHSGAASHLKLLQVVTEDEEGDMSDEEGQMDQVDDKKLAIGRVVKVNDGERLPELIFAASDDFGNRTAPRKGTEWVLVPNLSNAAIEADSDEIFSVDAMGIASVLGLSVDMDGKIGKEGTKVPLTLTLHERQQSTGKAAVRSKRRKSRARLSDAMATITLDILVLPSRAIRDIELRWNDEVFADETVSLPAGASVGGLSMQLLDGFGEAVDFDKALLSKGGVRVNDVRQDVAKLPQLGDVKVHSTTAGDEYEIHVVVNIASGKPQVIETVRRITIVPGVAYRWYVAPPRSGIGEYPVDFAAQHPDAVARRCESRSAEMLGRQMSFLVVDRYGNTAQVDPAEVDGEINGGDGCPIITFRGAKRDGLRCCSEEDGDIRGPVELYLVEKNNYFQLPAERENDGYLNWLEGEPQDIMCRVEGLGLQACTFSLRLCGGVPRHVEVKAPSIGIEDFRSHVDPLTVPCGTVIGDLQVRLVDEAGGLAEHPDLPKRHCVTVSSDVSSMSAHRVDCTDEIVDTVVPVPDAIMEDTVLSVALGRKKGVRARGKHSALDERVRAVEIPLSVAKKNRVSKVLLTAVDADMRPLPEGAASQVRFGEGSFPSLRMDIVTEDGVAFTPQVDAFKIEVRLQRADTKGSASDAIPVSRTHLEPIERDGALFLCGKDFIMDQESQHNANTTSSALLPLGTYAFTAAFTEYRAEMLGPANVQDDPCVSEPLEVALVPGAPKALVVLEGQDMLRNMKATCAAGADGDERVLVKDVVVGVVDAGGNVVDSPLKVFAEVDGEARLADEQNYPTGRVIAKAKVLDRFGKAYCFDRIGLHAGDGYNPGTFYLAICVDGDGGPSLRFEFLMSVSSERLGELKSLLVQRTALLGRMRDRRASLDAMAAPLRKANDRVLEVLATLDEGERLWLVAGGGHTQSLNSATPELVPGASCLRLEALRQRKTALALEVADFERASKASRPVRASRTLPMNVVALNPLGRVVDLGFVEDEKHARLLSWVAGKSMSAAVFPGGDAARQCYDECRYKSLALDMLLPFEVIDRGAGQKRLRSDAEVAEGFLPLGDVDAAGFVDYAVNLVILPAESERLRDSLFFSVFSTAMVFDTLRNAQTFRQALVRRRRRSPVLICEDGSIIRSNGLMDPSDRLPPLEHQPFVFGQQHATDTVHFRDVARRREIVDTLIECVEEVRRQEVALESSNASQVASQPQVQRELDAMESQLEHLDDAIGVLQGGKRGAGDANEDPSRSQQPPAKKRRAK